MKKWFNQLNEKLRGKNLIELLVIYADWIFTNSYLYFTGIILFLVAIGVSFLTNSNLAIAIGTVILIVLWLIPFTIEAARTADGSIPAKIRHVVTWKHALIVVSIVVFTHLLIAIIQRSVFEICLYTFLLAAGVFLTWVEIRLEKRKANKIRGNGEP